MAFTSAAMKAINKYIQTHVNAMKAFDFIGFEYEPTLAWQREFRENVAKKAGDYAKTHKHKKWLTVCYARTPLTYQLKRHDLIRSAEISPYLPASTWLRREVHCIFRYMFISPSPELLEEVEERFVVKDLGYVLEGNVVVGVRNSETKEIGPEYPFTFSVNIEKFTVENFEHFADVSEGVFSILTVNAITNYSVFVVDKILGPWPDDGSGNGGLAETIVLSLRCGGEDAYVEVSTTEIP